MYNLLNSTNMKKLWFLLLALPLVFAACDDDEGYSLGDYWVTTATVKTVGVSPYILETDGGKRLFPSASNVPRFEVFNGQRVWVNFTILGDGEGDIDHLVKVNDLSEMLTKGIFQLTPETTDSIGHDPLTINDYWISGDYLTVLFSYGGGQKIHFITLAQDVDAPINEDGLPVLEVRHNRNNDPVNYRLNGSVSFLLEDLRVDDSDEIRFVLRAKSPDGYSDFEEVLTYS